MDPDVREMVDFRKKPRIWSCPRPQSRSYIPQLLIPKSARRLRDTLDLSRCFGDPREINKSSANRCKEKIYYQCAWSKWGLWIIIEPIISARHSHLYCIYIPSSTIELAFAPIQNSMVPLFSSIWSLHAKHEISMMMLSVRLWHDCERICAGLKGQHSGPGAHAFHPV